MSINLLSSRLTFFRKFIFPILWITLFGVVTVAMWAGQLVDRQGSSLPIETRFTFLLVFITALFFILWACAGLKGIRVDDHSIYISNYLKEISVPVGMIADITEYWWISPPLITIHFRCETEFGNKITFTPKRRPFMSWGAHPAVRELRRLADISDTHR